MCGMLDYLEGGQRAPVYTKGDAARRQLVVFQRRGQVHLPDVQQDRHLHGFAQRVYPLHFDVVIQRRCRQPPFSVKFVLAVFFGACSGCVVVGVSGSGE